MLGRDPVLDALERWEEKGLLTGSLAGELRAEHGEEAERSSRRVSQYALALAGGIVLLIAVGVLAERVWPLLSDAARTGVLAATGVAVYGLGMRAEGWRRWGPAAYALQTAGLLVLVWGIQYSNRAWDDLSAAAVGVGVGALVTPLVTGTLALRRNRIMPAVHVALLPVFLAFFLDRAVPVSEDAILWILDAVMALLALVLVVGLRGSVRLGAPADEVDVRLWSLTVALYVALVLVAFTAMGPLNMGADTLWAVDAWWVGTTALTLWAIHGAPEPLRRDWYVVILATAVLIAIPFVFATCLEVLDWGSAGTAGVLAGLGAAGIGYGLRTRAMLVLRTAALTVVVAAWYVGVEEAGALGAVGALVFTAALLFWLSAKVGTLEGAPGPPGSA